MPPPDSAVAIIPARLGSTRFPGKVLKADTGKPLIIHVCEQAAKAECVSRVVIATDAPEVADAASTHGFEAVMTSPDHPNGTSRLAEAARQLRLKHNQCIVNVQGDEPEIDPSVIDGAVTALSVESPVAQYPELGPVHPAVGTVVSPLDDPSNPNVVKAVLGLVEPDQAVARALYFSRSPIPFDRDSIGSVRYYRHVGIYAYTTSMLEDYLKLEESPLERYERLEQLRWLEHGYSVAAAIRSSDHTGIDTEEQYRAFVARHSARSSGK